MKRKASLATAALAVVLALGSGVHWWSQHDRHTYLTGASTNFVALFTPPPAQDSPVTRRELEELLDLQRARSETDVAAARRDRKTEIERFYRALGFPDEASPRLPLLEELAERVEDDVRPYVRDAKKRFRRLRPYEIESRLDPCIANVASDLSYPSGHATFGYVMAYLLRDMVPEREAELLARADEFARQRMLCGVHFPSDIEAGRLAAQWLAPAFIASPAYRADANAATAELRAALKLPPRASRPL